MHLAAEMAKVEVVGALAIELASFARIGMEPCGFTAADIANLMSWFKGTAVSPSVRGPKVQYHLIARTLDAGALGSIVPYVKNAAEASAVVDAARCAPLGKRGVAIGTANTDFRNVDRREFLKYASENTTFR